MLDDISENNGKLLVKDGLFDNHDYSLVGYVGKKDHESEVTLCPYVSIVLSDEEYSKKFISNRKYALVRSDHPNELYARKKCEILGDKVENSTKMYLLNVDVSYSTKGFVHWVAFKKKYEEVWFIESDIEKFYEYDENGKLK